MVKLHASFGYCSSNTRWFLCGHRGGSNAPPPQLQCSAKAVTQGNWQGEAHDERSQERRRWDSIQSSSIHLTIRPKYCMPEESPCVPRVAMGPRVNQHAAGPQCLWDTLASPTGQASGAVRHLPGLTRYISMHMYWKGMFDVDVSYRGANEDSQAARSRRDSYDWDFVFPDIVFLSLDGKPNTAGVARRDNGSLWRWPGWRWYNVWLGGGHRYPYYADPPLGILKCNNINLLAARKQHHVVAIPEQFHI